MSNDNGESSERVDGGMFGDSDIAALERFGDVRGRIEYELGKVIVGQREVIDELLVAVFSRGHCILEGVPGLAKTLMISTLAKVFDMSFSRIQFTPDLMPSDITGTEVIEEDRDSGVRKFRFLRGPVFANVILADEINRTPPKTQAALLEAMQEGNVTVGGEGMRLPEPFFVLATQNPIEQEGTYPLPEAQQDRFMFKVFVKYPSFEEECRIAESTTSGDGIEVESILSADEVKGYQWLVRRVPVAEHVIDYALRLVRATRVGEDSVPEYVHRWVRWGAGPRAVQYLLLAGKARAAFCGRTCVTSEDISVAAYPVLRHRLVMNFNAESEGVSSDDLIGMLLEEIDEVGSGGENGGIGRSIRKVN